MSDIANGSVLGLLQNAAYRWKSIRGSIYSISAMELLKKIINVVPNPQQSQYTNLDRRGNTNQLYN